MFGTTFPTTSMLKRSQFNWLVTFWHLQNHGNSLRRNIWVTCTKELLKIPTWHPTNNVPCFFPEISPISTVGRGRPDFPLELLASSFSWCEKSFSFLWKPYPIILMSKYSGQQDLGEFILVLLRVLSLEVHPVVSPSGKVNAFLLMGKRTGKRRTTRTPGLQTLLQSSFRVKISHRTAEHLRIDFCTSTVLY